MTDTINPTDASTVTRQKMKNEIAHVLDDLISEIVETSENTDQSEEQAANTKDLLKELHKSSELFKRIDDINIVQFLDGNPSVNPQASGEKTILNGSLILDKKVDNCEEDLMESMIKNVENEERKSGQSRSKTIGSTNNAEFGFVGTNEQVMGEEIIKEMKRVKTIEEIVKNLVEEVLERLENNCLEFSNNKSAKMEIPIKVLDKTNQQNLPKATHQSVDGIQWLQQKRTLKNSLEQANMPEHSFTRTIENENFLKETVETAYTVFEDITNINRITRRAVSLIKTINERSRQSEEQGMGHLHEIQTMIQMVDGVSDINEYLQMDIRKMLVEQRELKEMARYVYEHLYTIKSCRSDKFIEKEATAVIQCGSNILDDIQIVRLQMCKLFRDYLLMQRSFLNHSLYFTGIPYELIIGDNRWKLFLNRVKGSVIGMCGNIFIVEGFKDYREGMLSDFKKIVRRVEEFTELVILLDHMPHTKKYK